MHRRKFIARLGSFAAAGAAGIGTGAFTSVQADRDVTVDVGDDTGSFLALSPVPRSGNADYVEVESGQLSADLSGGNDLVFGDGVNSGGTTVIGNLFRIENQGTQTTYVWLQEDGGRNGSQHHAFYVGSWSAGNSGATAISLANFNGDLDGLKPDGRQRQPQHAANIDTSAVALGVGAHVDVGLVVDVPHGRGGKAVLKHGQGPTIHATTDQAALADVLAPPISPP